MALSTGGIEEIDRRVDERKRNERYHETDDGPLERLLALLVLFVVAESRDHVEAREDDAADGDDGDYRNDAVGDGDSLSFDPALKHAVADGDGPLGLGKAGTFASETERNIAGAFPTSCRGNGGNMKGGGQSEDRKREGENEELRDFFGEHREKSAN